ncbi:hypothetical protein SAQ01S_06680 [Sphingomonas aquatilis NBRC 16722]|jgi:hypothetical protein|nr:hypothetical protein SAQ01S_06680 [Sphingomonas aquatilis NBRC 16722]
MRGLALVAIGTIALSGCAGAQLKKPAVCDGKHRRPANAYGSVLPTLPIPVPVSQAAARSMIAPPSGSAPPQQPASAPEIPTLRGSGTPSSSSGREILGPAAKPRLSNRIVARSYLPC